MINKERLLNEFLNLISFDAESYHEREIADYLKNELNNLGFSVDEDDANVKNAIYHNFDPKLSSGNIYAFKKGNVKGEPILLSAHLDTVCPGKNKKAIIENNLVKSDGSSVLGSDDATGIASILEALRVIKEKNLKHHDIEIIFFTSEEPYCKGSKVFDYKKIKSKVGYVFDLSGKVGNIAISAPSIISFKAEIFGKASHAGFNPEDGISAILLLSKLINNVKSGRVANDTTLNFGVISGGSLNNIVPDYSYVTGEIRSSIHNKAIHELKIIENELMRLTKEYNALYDFKYDIEIEAYRVDIDELVIKRYKKVMDNLNIKDYELINTFGGSDGNNLNKYGIKSVVVANAMNNCHSKDEYFYLDDFYKSALIALHLIID